MSHAPIYRLRDYVPPGGCFHLARSHYVRGVTCQLHRHDFAEVFWIERGRALHTINREQQTLTQGDVVFIRPRDTHGFRAAHHDGFILVNLAFEAHVLDRLHRDMGDKELAWLASDARLPCSWKLGAESLAAVTAAVEQLSMTRQSRLDLHWFLLQLLRRLRDQAAGAADAAPWWLRAAVRRFEETGDLSGSAATLAAIANCSVEHLNRVVRGSYGLTTTDLINRLRLDRAAQRLRMTADPIARIALDCGFENLGYFYRRFSARFQTTPRRYRLTSQALVR